MEYKSWLRTMLQHYADPDRTFRDVDAVLQLYISLKPKMDTYTYNDGHTQLLLCLHGTVPITYRSIPYNIPVAFWIPSDYPRNPPIPYVKPTSSMIVREGKHVDKSGLCYHPYRFSWKENPNKHNLPELVAILQQVFSQEPPVYTKPPSHQSPMLSHPSLPHVMPSMAGESQQQQQQQQQRHSFPTNSPTLPPPPPPPPPPPSSHPMPSTSTPYSSSNTPDSASPRWPGDGTAYYNIHQGLAAMSLSPTAYASATPPPVPTSSTSTGMIPKPQSLPVLSPSPNPSTTSTPPSATAGSQPQSQSLSQPATSLVANARQSSTTGRPLENKERDLQYRLYRKVAERMQQFNLSVSAEMDRLLAINRQLNDGEVRIDHELQMWADLKRRLENNIQVLKIREKEIEEVISTVNAMPDMAVDEVLCGTTVVYNQLFDLVADDNAIVDTIYYLGKALNSERIDIATFIKYTRTLAREQFMKRALMIKICDGLKYPMMAPTSS
ncbi:UEV domain-containing protein [Dichotomocladium elegans]|nr:UEV domain-containing protein [Dichotomocladium elegans]